MQKYSFFILVLVLASLIMVQSCKEEGTANGILHFHPKIGSSDFSFDTPIMVNGVNVKFTRAQFYIHDLVLEAENSDDNTIVEGYFVVNASQHHYQLGSINRGTIKGVSFNVGVDAVSNHEDPSILPAENPLSSEHPLFQHWSWDAGYRFITLEGSVDADGDGTFETIMEFHIGKDSNLVEVNVTGLNKEILEGDQMINIEVDYAKFLTGLDLETESISHVADYPEVANTLVGNVPSVFSAQ